MPIDPTVRWSQIREAGQSLDASRLALLIEGLAEVDPPGEPNEKLRTISAWALGRIGFDVAGDLVIELVSDPNPLVRAAAVDALGEMRDRRALGLLAEALEDSSNEVVLWSCLSLSKLGDEAVPVLEMKMTDENGRLPRAGYMADALVKIASPKAEAALLRSLSKLEGDTRRDLEYLLSR